RIGAPAPLDGLRRPVRDRDDVGLDGRTERGIQRRRPRRSAACPLALPGCALGRLGPAPARPQLAADHAILPAGEDLTAEHGAVLYASAALGEGVLLRRLGRPAELPPQYDLRLDVRGDGRGPA